MPDVICLGEALIDFVAMESGVSVGAARGFLKAPGGAPANVAVGVAKLGHTSAFLGKVGDDPFGRFLASTFADAGVDTDGILFDPVHRTGLAFVALSASGDRSFCFFRNPSADMTYTPDELDRERIAGGKIFHFGSITLIDEPARSATLAAVQIARDNGLLISYDPNLRVPLWPNLKTAKSTLLQAASLADIIKVSEEELAFLTGKEATLPTKPLNEKEVGRFAARLRKQFPTLAILAVTRGEEGCFWQTRGGAMGVLPGQEVTAVDTTGAGDGFVAGMLCGLLERNLLRPEAIAAAGSDKIRAIFALANIVGALTTTSKGAIPGLPTLSQVADYLQRTRKTGNTS